MARPLYDMRRTNALHLGIPVSGGGGGSDDEPVFNASTDLPLLVDDFSWANVTAMLAPSGWYTYLGESTFEILADGSGPGGVGKAFRVGFTISNPGCVGGQDQSHLIDTVLGAYNGAFSEEANAYYGAGGATHIVTRWDIRYSDNFEWHRPDCEGEGDEGKKEMFLYQDVANRFLLGVTNTRWSFNSDNWTIIGPPGAVYWNNPSVSEMFPADWADGLWHSIVMELDTDPPVGDMVTRIWFDGVLGHNYGGTSGNAYPQGEPTPIGGIEIWHYPSTKNKGSDRVMTQDFANFASWWPELL